MSKKLLVLFLSGFVFFLPSIVLACGIFIPPPYQQVTTKEQKAVIWHDGSKETLVVSPTFEGDAKDFAWIIPVPARPEVSKMSDELFTSLNQLTQPLVPPPPGPLPIMGIGSVSNLQVPPPVTVLETKRIDVYDTAVLSAKDPNALKTWLANNGFSYPDDKDYLLKYYVDKDWYFVAAKINQEAQSYTGQYLNQGHLTPLSLTFESKQIIYPFKISGPRAKETTASDKKIVAAHSFEKGLEGWTPYAAGTDPKSNISAAASVTVTQDEAFEGESSLKIYNANGVGDAYAFTWINFLTPGERYVFSAYAKAKPAPRIDTTHSTVSLKVQMAGADNRSPRLSFSVYRDWTRIVFPFTAVGDGHEFDLLGNSMPPGSVLYFDSVQVEKGTTATPFTKEIWPPKPIPTLQPESGFTTLLYIFADHKKSLPGFSINYAAWVESSKISKLAFGGNGEPWMKTSKDMYLTKLSRYVNPTDITDDLVARNADDNDSVGIYSFWDNQSNRILVAMISILGIEFIAFTFIYKRIKNS